MKRATIALALLLSSIACTEDRTANLAGKTGQPAAVQPATLTPEELGELGAQIRKDPARAQQILTERGLTQEAFEKQIRDLTENPDASRRYAEAYRKASN